MKADYCEGMKKRKLSLGRPKVDAPNAFTCRHVVNISPKMEDAVKLFAAANGIARLTDAMRQMLTKCLRNDGYLK